LEASELMMFTCFVSN